MFLFQDSYLNLLTHLTQNCETFEVLLKM